MSLNSAAPSAHLPLQGLRVVEIGTSVAAPYATWILATLGADVVKVEPPGAGDDARQWGAMFADGRGAYFEALNRDKRGITVDLRDDAERRWLRDYCAEHADVVLQNLRAGKVDAMGLGAVDLVAANPRLVYCNLRAFGASGPLKDRPGYDPLMQAFGGIMSVTGEEGRPPVRVGSSIIDMGSGMWCALGVITALFRREKTGRGCVIDASLYETALGWMANPVALAQARGESPRRSGSGMHGMAPYQAYPCSDGDLVVAAPNDRLFEALCSVLGHPEWPADERFASNQARSANLAALNALIEPLLATRSRDEWQAALDAAGVPSAPVRSTLEMMAEPQTEALGMLQSLPGCEPRFMGLPLSFDGERPPFRNRAPELGEHDEQVRRESGARRGR